MVKDPRKLWIVYTIHQLYTYFEGEVVQLKRKKSTLIRLVTVFQPLEAYILPLIGNNHNDVVLKEYVSYI